MTTASSSGAEPRATCLRCMRAEVACYCAHIRELPTATRVLLLQHPRERDVAIGTARMAHLCLPNSELRIGADFSEDPVVKRAIAGGAYLLFPSEDAIELDEIVTTEPITLVVVDGTWSQARSLCKRNPALAALPKVRFTPRGKSEYRIRREPADHCVATIEALAHVLGELEGDRARFEALLAPFRAMVELQLDYAARVHGMRERHARTRPRGPRAPKLPAALLGARERLVCIQGEANAWPVRGRRESQAELVHWVATRPYTGERLDCVIAPRSTLAPRTSRYIRIAEEELLGGATWAAFLERFTAFLREDDVLCMWGRYPLDMLEKEGLSLPHATVDLRVVANAYFRGGVRSVHDACGQSGARTPALVGRGRGGERIASLESVIDAFLSQHALASSPAPSG